MMDQQNKRLQKDECSLNEQERYGKDLAGYLRDSNDSREVLKK